MKNGSELLDRLIKDIISDSATSYVSILHDSEDAIDDDNIDPKNGGRVEIPTAFSLPRFIPLLQERVYVLNPFTRMFLVSWITLLDSIPDLYLVSFLPSFLDAQASLPDEADQVLDEGQDSNEVARHTDNDSASVDGDASSDAQEDWVPGQDVQIDHPKILDILVTYLRDSKGMETPLQILQSRD